MLNQSKRCINCGRFTKETYPTMVSEGFCLECSEDQCGGSGEYGCGIVLGNYDCPSRHCRMKHGERSPDNGRFCKVCANRWKPLSREELSYYFKLLNKFNADNREDLQ